ncbi:hypothetical protein FBY06_12012 [Pseudomonas sp. SJZ085]|nr:hypothetical protein FBY00_15810 [Pseudomonas sp. SJZ075]TWC16454.1 hypothetical protein FBX99_12085 [Pseudomonas sp. SJZ074]TWC25435.1 hypothetical protein FBY02_1575 [Pseudomonas sp. SJZ078]TWC34465.1 hypothetical protein FBY06_12012 [Pseudomonas sp. SJZ085]TWC44794.1 hypothetical protein FBY11_15910 [Pseudomonas sp. SJZ124]TWC79957.1 hypothetical protein FBY09_1585 [Pseudomonas sp. SJZ101]
MHYKTHVGASLLAMGPALAPQNPRELPGEPQ